MRAGGTSLDDLIRACQQRRGDREAEHCGGLEVDHQLELGGLLDGKVGRLAALQDAVDVGGGTSEHLSHARPVGHQATPPRELPEPIHRRKVAGSGELHDARPVTEGERARPHDEPPAPSRAIVANAASNSLASRTPISRSLTRSAVAAVSMSRNDRSLAALAWSKRTAMREARGTASFSSSTHFPANPSSNATDNPVTLPPGRARLSTRPAPTGSATPTKTMGTVVVAFLAAIAPRFAAATITSTLSLSRSVTRSGKRSDLPSAQRSSMRIFCPSVHPSSRRPCLKASAKFWFTEREPASRKPMRGIVPAGCASAASGTATSPPAKVSRNLRRFVGGASG